MNRKALDIVFTYVEEQAVPVQITYDGKGDYTVDFQSRLHAEVCAAELRYAKHHEVTTLLTGHHMRLK